MTTNMEAGTFGNLTAGEERKLQEAWTLLFELSGVDMGPNHQKSSSYNHLSSLVAQPEDFRQRLWRASPPDHPDVTILRFLRARKWDVEKAMDMLISSLNWREERHINELVIGKGDSAALGADPATAKEEADFIAQYRSGKSYVRSTDREGRPVYIVRVKLHLPSQQSPESMETYVLHNIETISSMMRSPNEKCCLLFDLTGFGISNMDFHVVKFLVQVFEARYPETLGQVLVHNAPFVFWGESLPVLLLTA